MGGRWPSTMVRLGVAAMLAVALPGCAALGLRWPGHHASADAVAPTHGQRARDKAVAAAERAVASHPGDPLVRAALGRAYLSAGRPASAVYAFTDALTLGDTTAASIVGLALGRIATGERGAAIALLDEWQASLPAGDRGLALALAGDTGRAVEVLAAALRQGGSDARLRQNLALACALDGRWREAALIAAVDLPPARVRERIEAWARLARADAASQRVAYVLRAPLRADPGYPAALALVPADPGTELAAAPVP